jgi:acid stress-induced BolA-like protein IbaG/YrbA
MVNISILTSSNGRVKVIGLKFEAVSSVKKQRFIKVVEEL